MTDRIPAPLRAGPPALWADAGQASLCRPRDPGALSYRPRFVDFVMPDRRPSDSRPDRFEPLSARPERQAAPSPDPAPANRGGDIPLSGSWRG